MYTDNPLTDFATHDFQQQKDLEQLPICSCCDEHITDDYCYIVNDEPVCEACLNSYYRRAVDDLCP